MTESNSNPARQSAGGAAGAHGVSFQAQAAAWWIGQVLLGNRLVGRQFGVEENAVPMRVGGQTGMFTDDLGVEFSNGQRSFGQCKSRVRLSADWPSETNEFASAWVQFYRQLEHCGPDETPALFLCFEDETEPLQSLATILNRHRNHSGQVELSDPRIAVTSKEERVADTLLRLLDRLSSAPELAGLKTGRSRLLCSTYLHHLRMQESGGDYLQLAQLLQSSVLADGERIGDAMRLILGLGEKLHKERTSIGLDQVRREFRLAGIELQDVRDHREDWSKLEEVSGTAKTSVFTTIGRNLHLGRLSEIKRVQKALKTSSAVAVLGPSGGGKSGVVKGWADELDPKENRVVWFSAAELDAMSALDLRSAFGLKFSLQQLFGAAGTKNGYVVIDAIDRCFSDNGLQRVRQILEACALEDGESIWRVVFTCQDTEWAQVLPRLLRARVPLPQDTKPGVVGLLTREELAEISSRIPALRHLLSQHHLRELLIKPKVLDLIACYLETGGQVDASSFVGESQLIAWWWHAEVQVGSKAHARAAALSEIAQRQADQMRVFIALDELSPSARDLVDDLAHSRLVVVSGNRLNFAHDLYGDWARQRVLLAHGIDLPAFVLPGMKSPLWHKPLRLYALHQLENGLEGSAWERDWRGFAGNSAEAQLARDLFLEAVVFAAEPKPILEKLWPSFSRENGALLSRFLRRFQYAASIPDELFLNRARADGPEQVIETAAAIRIPLLLRWPPVIEFLHAHCTDVAALVPGELAKMAFTWFGWTEPGLRGRREIAALIVSAAEHCCRLGLHDYRSHDETTVEQVYRSALRAFAEEPARVRELSLRLCGRKENDWLIKEEPKPRKPLPESLANDPAFQEIANIGTTPIGGPIENWEVVGPWPDGPQFDVSHEFREAFLKGDAHRAMIDKEPALASEVLLSLLIEHSHRVSPFDALSSHLDEDRGLQSQNSLEQPFYNTGPFLYFLQSHADAGLEFLLQFINFASERWEEQFARRDEEIWKVTIRLADKELVLFGDWRLYYAYRNASWIHGAIRAGVMALEKWLHDKIEADSPVDDVIDRILDGARSVAFAGVLIAIAKRRNELLWTKLWPLTCAAEFHCWEATQNGQFVPGTGTGWNEPSQLRERRAKWNNLPFRRENLLGLCCRLFLDDPVGRKRLSRLKNIWLRRARTLPKDASFKSTLGRLAQHFDIACWTRAKNEDGEEAWAFTPPSAPPVADADEAASSESEPLQLTALPFLCRDALGGGDWPLAREPDQIWELLEIVLEVAREQSGETYGLRDPQDAVAGLIAVLLKFHREWLRADPEHERACLDNLLRVPERAVRPLPDLFGATGREPLWAIFCSEQLPLIWAATPASSSIRGAIAQVVISGSDTAVAMLLGNLFLVRDKLAAEFEQTQALLLRDAVERNRHQWARALEDDPARYADWIEREVADFSSGHSRALPADWLAIRHPQFPMHYGHSYRFEKRTTRQNYGLDFDRVVGAFAWIPSLDQAASPAEREQWMSLHREILRCLLGTFPCRAEGSHEYEGLPYQVDRQVLARSAKLALEVRDDEDHAAFWKPVLALGTAGHAWVADFIRDFFMPALETPTPPPYFARRWKAMLEFAESSPTWQNDPDAKPWELEKLWLNLIGVDSLLHLCWQPEHRDILAEVWPNVERWAQRYLGEEESLRAFLDFMKLPVVSEWIPNALILIDDAFSNVFSDGLAEDFPEDQLARFLVLVHEQHASFVRRVPKVYEVFTRLVANLAAAQNRIALELQSRLAGEP